LVGKDGKTPYERRRGRKCRVPVVPFGETVWYKEIKENKAKADSAWTEGIWLGHHRESNETLVGTNEGVVRAYAIIRKQEGQRWDRERLKNMKGTPQKPDPSKDGLIIPLRITFDEPSENLEEESQLPRKEEGPRIMMIRREDLEEHGYTEGCDGCREKRTGMQERRGHSEACRKRLGEAMEKTEAGKRRKEADEERVNKRLAAEVERADKRGKAEEPDPLQVQDPLQGQEEGQGTKRRAEESESREA